MVGFFTESILQRSESPIRLRGAARNDPRRGPRRWDGFIRSLHRIEQGAHARPIRPPMASDLLGVTTNPNGPWVTQVARNFCTELEEAGRRFLIRDRDIKFTASIDQIFASIGAMTILTPVRSPNANANTFAERWVRIFREDCLDHCSSSRSITSRVSLPSKSPTTTGAGLIASGPRATAPSTIPQREGGVHRRDLLGWLIHEHEIAA
jgi:putative transposase